MAKAKAAKTKAVHFVTGDFALVPRDEYERLRRVDAEATEDAADLETVRASKRAIAEGREVVLPSDIATRIMKGENPVRVVREWRKISQGDAARLADISQSYLSDIEHGTRKGTAVVNKRIAAALKVPTDLLIND